jgi:hypothetical protein
MRITNPAKRLSAAVLAIAATAVFAASTSAHQTLVHTHRDRSGTVLVTGYDGGAPLAPAR